MVSQIKINRLYPGLLRPEDIIISSFSVDVKYMKMKERYKVNIIDSP